MIELKELAAIERARSRQDAANNPESRRGERFAVRGAAPSLSTRAPPRERGRGVRDLLDTGARRARVVAVAAAAAQQQRDEQA